MTNLAVLLESTVQSHPERVAIVSGDRQFTYRQVNAAANQVANWLVKRGIRPGDAVAMSMPNVPHFSAIYFGILKAGATVVPLNVLLKGREVAYHLNDSRAKAYFAFEGSADLPIGDAAVEGYERSETCLSLNVVPRSAFVEPMWSELPGTFATVDRNDDDTAVILYTSGTTGRPKGAELRHRNLRDNALASGQLFAANVESPDTYLCALPLFHAFGQTCIQNGGFAFGATLVMMPRFEAGAALDLMMRNGVTVFAGVPTMYWALLAALDSSTDTGDLDAVRLASTLRVAISGGAALPGEIHQQFKHRFGVTILEGYGLSETSPTASFARFGEEPRVGSIGVPIPGVEMKLINDDWSDVADIPGTVGEIAIRGHNVMKGYLHRPVATSDVIRDGWFRSGDLATKDENDFYYIVDRVKDMIIRGGYNVYPREIEEVLMGHPAVSLVAVVGMPHESYGEEIRAVVVKNKNHDDLTEADLVTWAKDQLAAYKYPRVVEFADELPMTSTGKILKREL